MILRASCFSVEHIDDQDFNVTMNFDQDRAAEDFVTINRAIKEVMDDMAANWLQYAEQNFRWWLEKNFDDTTPSIGWKGLVNSLADYMNTYLQPEQNQNKWGIIVCGGCHVRENRIAYYRGIDF